MKCFLQSVRSWYFSTVFLQKRHSIQYTGCACLRQYHSSKELCEVHILPQYRGAKPNESRQQFTRYDSINSSKSSIKPINLDLAKYLFHRNIESSLLFKKKFVSTSNRDIAWLICDSTKEVILSKLKDLEIPHVVSLFQEVRNKHSSFHRTAFIIEEAMIARVKTLDMETCLHFSEIMLLSGFRGYKFLNAFFEHSSYIKIEDIETQHVPRLMFFVFFYGGAPYLLLSRLEDMIYDKFESFSLKDLSVICLGYFRGHRRIHSYDLLDKIANKTIKDMTLIDEQQLTNILKAFRHSGYLSDNFFIQLADRLSSKNVSFEVSKMNTIMHLLLVFASLKIYHKPLLEYLADRTYTLLNKSSMSNKFPRTKEIAKITWAFGTFRFKPENHKQFLNILSMAFQKSMAMAISRQYPESVADIVQGLMYLNVFPADLMRQLLQPDVAQTLRDHPTAEKIFQLLLADSTARIECSNYTGPFLSQEFHNSIRDKHGVFRDMKSELIIRQGLSCILDTLLEILGIGCVHCHFILPHMKTADIEIRLDCEGFPTEFEPLDYRQLLDLSRQSTSHTKSAEVFRRLAQEYRSMQPKTTDKKAPKRLVVEVIGRNQCAHKSNFLLGNYQTKLRQLRKLGYETWLIYPEESNEIEQMGQDERYRYIRQKLCDVYGLSPDIPPTIRK